MVDRLLFFTSLHLAAYGMYRYPLMALNCRRSTGRISPARRYRIFQNPNGFVQSGSACTVESQAGQELRLTSTIAGDKTPRHVGLALTNDGMRIWKGCQFQPWDSIRPSTATWPLNLLMLIAGCCFGSGLIMPFWCSMGGKTALGRALEAL